MVVSFSIQLVLWLSVFVLCLDTREMRTIVRTKGTELGILRRWTFSERARRAALETKFGTMDTQLRRSLNAIHNIVASMHEDIISSNHRIKEHVRRHRCRDGYKFVNEDLWESGLTCYHLPFKYACVSWSEAVRKCRDEGTELLTVNDRITFKSIQQLAREETVSGGCSNNGFWVSASDIGQEGVWQWANGYSVSSLYWGRNEPNGGSAENCAILYPSKDYRLNDMDCVNRRVETICVY